MQLRVAQEVYLRSLLLETNRRDERGVETGYSMHFLEKKVCLETTAVVFKEEREVPDALTKRARAVGGDENLTRRSSVGVDEVRGDWVYVRG